MKEKAVKIGNRNGLHARPAAQLVKIASKFTSDIYLGKDGMEVNAKSIMGVMMLAAEVGSTLTVKAEGPDEAEAVESIVELIENNFGEE